MINRFKIICSNCGESCTLEQPTPMVHKKTAIIEVKHDAIVETNGITECYFEISCSQCGNNFRLSM